MSRFESGSPARAVDDRSGLSGGNIGLWSMIRWRTEQTPTSKAGRGESAPRQLGSPVPWSSRGRRVADRGDVVSPSADRRSVWKAAADRYAIPRLMGEWLIVGSRQLMLRPLGMIVRGVTAQQFTVFAILEPLFMPLDSFQASWLIATDCNMRRTFSYNDLKLGGEHAEKYMNDLAEAINDTAYPFLVENGSLEGYLEHCRRRNDTHPNGRGDVNELFRQAATAVMLSRPDDAMEALGKLRQVIESDPTDDRDYVRDLYEQAGAFRDRVEADAAAVRDELIGGIDEQKRRRGLPLSA